MPPDFGRHSVGKQTAERSPAGKEMAEKRLSGAYYHPHFDALTIKVMLGQHRISKRADEMLVTTLGSCVAACIRDPVAAVGGMNHFLLPEVPESQKNALDEASRYGSVAMERLINEVLAHGGRRARLEVKVFGGAKVIDSSFDVGEKNGAFVLDYIRREGLTLVGQDLGGAFARRVHYFPITGRALRRVLRPEILPETFNQELTFMSSLRRKPIEGDVELFGEE
ncbi:putative chemoreceptor glutamine deamidase CheD [Azospirillaceae bacterium]